MGPTDRLAILELLPRYAKAFDEGAIDDLHPLFTPDAAFQVHGRIGDMPSLIEGREAIVAHMRRRWSEVQPTQRRHVITNQHIDPGDGPDRAIVHAYLVLTTTTSGVLSVMMTAKYSSGVVREESGWALHRHELHLDADIG